MIPLVLSALSWFVCTTLRIVRGCTHSAFGLADCLYMFFHLTLESAWTHGDISRYIAYKSFVLCIEIRLLVWITMLRVFIRMYIIDRNEHIAHDVRLIDLSVSDETRCQVLRV